MGKSGARAGRLAPPTSAPRQWVDFLLARYQSPLVVLAEVYSRSLDVLVAELGCDRLEAFRLQLSAAEKLAPYVHAKQPVAIQIDPSGVVKLILETVAPEVFADEDGAGLVIEGKVLALPPAEGNGDKTTG